MTQSGSAMVANRTARHPISPPVSLVSHDSPDAGSAERLKRKNTLQEPSAIKACSHRHRSWLDDTGAPATVQKGVDAPRQPPDHDEHLRQGHDRQQTSSP